jgi:hypothetical protein
MLFAPPVDGSLAVTLPFAPPVDGSLAVTLPYILSPSEARRERVRFNRLKRRNPAAHALLPVGEALLDAILDPPGPDLIALNSGVGSGKSYALAQGIVTVALTRPGSEQIVSMETAGRLFGVMRPRIAEIAGTLARWIGGTVEPRFEFENGSVVRLMAYYMPSTRDEAHNPWEGSDSTCLWTDETQQLKASVFEHSFQRCRLNSYDIDDNEYTPTVVWCGRPGAVMHWMEKAEELAESIDVRRLVFPTRSNWLLPRNYLDNMRASMDRTKYECVTQEVIGARMPMDGAIYSDFKARHWSDGGNLIKRAELGDIRSRPTYCVIDFGVNTSAVGWVQEMTINGRPSSVLVDEWCPDEATSTRDLVSGILARGWVIDEAICDPAGDARQRAAKNTSEVAILRRGIDEDPGDGLGGGLGCPVHAHVPASRRGVRDGVFRVQARIEDADGSRAFYVLDDLWDSPKGKRGIRHTVLGYTWGKDGQPVKGRKADESDHFADVIRLYVIRRAWDAPPQLDKLEPTPPKPTRSIPARKHAFTRRAHRQRR